MLVSTGQQQMHGKASPIRHDFSPQYRYCTTTVGADTITTGAVASISPQCVLNPVS
jgi:hypothetical protein